MSCNKQSLIEAIKRRPPLYDVNDVRFGFRELKDKLWQEVGMEVFPLWNQYTPEDRVKHVGEIQKTWKNLRTRYMRELKTQREQADNPSTSRKKNTFLYFDNLTFLPIGVAELLRLSDDDIEVGFTGLLEPRVEIIDPEDQVSETQGPTAPNLQRIEQNTTSDSMLVSDDSEINHVNNVSTSQSRHDNNDQESTIANINSNGQQSRDDDDDKLFVMSLIPSFRRLPLRNKMTARIEIMQIIARMNFDDRQ